MALSMLCNVTMTANLVTIEDYGVSSKYLELENDANGNDGVCK